MEVNFSELKDLVSSGELVIVDFWGEWCGPCKVYGPIFNEFGENNPEVNIKKVNIDQYKEAAVEYGVRGIPTTLIFKDGEAIERLSGVQTLSLLQEKLETYA